MISVKYSLIFVVIEFKHLNMSLTMPNCRNCIAFFVVAFDLSFRFRSTCFHLTRPPWTAEAAIVLRIFDIFEYWIFSREFIGHLVGRCQSVCLSGGDRFDFWSVSWGVLSLSLRFEDAPEKEKLTIYTNIHPNDWRPLGQSKVKTTKKKSVCFYERKLFLDFISALYRPLLVFLCAFFKSFLL